jgi:hypothetical protein
VVAGVLSFRAAASFVARAPDSAARSAWAAAAAEIWDADAGDGGRGDGSSLDGRGGVEPPATGVRIVRVQRDKLMKDTSEGIG